ncbi:MAG: HAD family hydrolase [Spirochaetia bacterium]|nr:HAD family hydrolase [Spirochaetia bacterium]
MHHYKFKAVFFDMDGTLLYTLPDIARAANRALAVKGFPEHPVEAYRGKVGWGLDETLRRALPEEFQNTAATTSLVEELTVELLREYRRLPYQDTTPYEGIPELLAELQQRSIRLAILSNKEHLLTNTIAAEFFPHVEFMAVQGASDKIPPKPDPQGVQLLLRTVDVLPEEVLYVGDSGIDMDTAVSAGLFPVGVSWGYRPVAELQERGARMLLNAPKELLSLFPLSVS